jgi:hypothetical protein
MCNGILTCAIDQVCRTPCQFASECGTGQVCTGNVCAELSDLDVNGQLTRVVPMVDGGVKDAGKDSMPPDTQVENLPDPDTRPRDTATPDTTLSPDTALAPDTSPPDTRIVDLALPDTNPPDTAPPAPDTAPIDGASLVLTGCSAPALSQRYFCDDFEAGLDKWVVSGRDWNTTATVSRSPARCVTDSPEGNYPNGAKNEITLAASVDLTTAISPVLTFWHMLGLHDNGYITDYYGDLTYVDASTDGGSTWTQLKRFTLTDSTTTWAQVQLSLASVAGKKAKLRFRLVDQAGSGTKDGIDPTQANGWHIDDVEIREAN